VNENDDNMETFMVRKSYACLTVICLGQSTRMTDR
jgi:hypothetical protein